MDKEHTKTHKIFYTNPPYKIYVEQFGNKKENLPSVLFIHGGYHTGFCYIQTPDGRLGWAPLLANKGLNVYVTDMPDMGKSGSIPFENINGNFIVESYVDLIKNIDEKIILVTHSLAGSLGFKIAELLPEKVIGVISIEPSLPGNIENVVEPYFESENITKAKLGQIDCILDMSKYSYASEQLIKSFTIDGTTQFPNDQKTLEQYKSSLQKIHPRLIYERLNIKNSQVRITDYLKLLKTKFLVITSPKNMVHVRDDKKIADTFRPYGISVDHYKLDDVGIEGNGHMMMIEKNNTQILDFIIDWIKNKLNLDF